MIAEQLDLEAINDLITVTVVIGLFVFWIASRDIPVVLALLVAILRVFLPFIYFAFFNDGTWNFWDDFVYQLQGTTMLELGYNPISALVDENGVATLMGLAEGKHILYGWWNLLAQYLFGKHYFSPVFLNVALTFLIGYYLVRIAQLCGFSREYSTKLLLFYLVHWELVSWSSIINLKDILIMFLTVVSFFAIFKITEGKIQYLILLSIPIYCFYWLRFYIPFMILLATLIWVVLFMEGRNKYFLLICVMFVVRIVMPSIQAGLEEQGDQLSPSLMGLIVGPFRMLSLTPQPWSIQPEYTFLFISSILNWIFFLPAVIGGWNLWRQSKKASLLLVYLIISLMFYANFPGQDGPRHRVQLMFIIVWIEFHFLHKAWYKKVPTLKT
jgi:hypothetical protein